jgi:hypothetical protein
MLGGMLPSFPLPTWAWTFLTILAAVGYWLPPLLVPVFCPVRPPKIFEPVAPASRWKGLAFSLSVAVAAVAIQYEATLHKRTWDKCQESYFSEAALMVRNHTFPMVGYFMGELTTHLGPYFYYLLDAYQLVSPSPSLLFWSILINFGLACVLVERLGRKLFGQPWGAVAVLLLATSPRLVRTFFEPAHGGLVPLPLAAFAWCIVSLFQTPRAAPLLLGAWCLAVASQMHGITVLLLLGTLLALALVRPRLRWRAWLLSAGVWFLSYATWIRYYARSSFADFFHMGAPHAYHDPSQTRLVLLRAEFGGWLAILGVAGFGLLAWSAIRRRKDDPDRPLWLALLAILGVSNAAGMAAYGQWEARYDLSFFPFSTLLVAGMLALVWGLLLQAWRTQRLVPRLISAVAVVLLAVMPALSVAERVSGAFFGRGVGPIVSGPLTYDEQHAVANKLRELGFSVEDLARRMHGPNWEPPSTARVYLALNAPKVNAADSRAGGSVYVVANCRRVTKAFSKDQVQITPLDQQITLAPYTPRLSIDRTRLTTAAGVLWESPTLLPVTEEWGLTGQEWNLGGLDAALAPSESRRAFFALWHKEPTSKLHVHGTFAPGPDNRLLVLSGYGKRPMTMRIDGQDTAPTVDMSPGDTYAQYFLLRNHERATDLELTLDNANRPVPFFVDLYETPTPPCSEYDKFLRPIEFAKLAPADDASR